jgi:hypothetical protein
MGGSVVGRGVLVSLLIMRHGLCALRWRAVCCFLHAWPRPGRVQVIYLNMNQDKNDPYSVAFDAGTAQ